MPTQPYSFQIEYITNEGRKYTVFSQNFSLTKRVRGGEIKEILPREPRYASQSKLVDNDTIVRSKKHENALFCYHRRDIFSVGKSHIIIEILVILSPNHVVSVCIRRRKRW